MKASKLIELAHTNPSEYKHKQYKVISGFVIDGWGKEHKRVNVRVLDDETIYLGCEDGSNNAYFCELEELEPIPEPPKPVPFMDAVNYAIENSVRGVIYCRHKGIIKAYGGTEFTTFGNEPVTFDEICNGEWYTSKP